MLHSSSLNFSESMNRLFLSIMLCTAMFWVVAPHKSIAQIMTTTQATVQTTTTNVSSTTSAIVQTPAKKEKPKPSKKLRIFLETRNVVARPEGYETLLTIEEDGSMNFQWHTVSGRSNTMNAQLKPTELVTLKKLLDFDKLYAMQPTTNVMYADWMQYLTVEKDEKSKSIRMMIEYRKKTKEAIDENIKQQLGDVVVKEIWKFIDVVRALNNRFRFQQ
jgi:hypothetical protein